MMKMRIGVLTDSSNLYNKIRLLLRKEYEVVMLTDAESSGCSLILRDIESFPNAAGAPELLLGDGCDVPLPFRHEELLEAVASALSDTDEDTAITLFDNGKGARVLGEDIKLTELEFKLLKRLLSSDGFVSKDEVLKSVWDCECDAGIVNVYVYYLRKKIEKSANKIIISSRNGGYKIDEKYRRKS
jgi:hypothetical protein